MSQPRRPQYEQMLSFSHVIILCEGRCYQKLGFLNIKVSCGCDSSIHSTQKFSLQKLHIFRTLWVLLFYLFKTDDVDKTKKNFQNISPGKYVGCAHVFPPHQKFTWLPHKYWNKSRDTCGLEYTGLSNSLCAPDDYNTESYELYSKCTVPVSRHLLPRQGTLDSH
jgi:hypothetical protein